MIKFNIVVMGCYTEDEKLNVIKACYKGCTSDLKTAVLGCIEEVEKDHPKISIDEIIIKDCVKI